MGAQTKAANPASSGRLRVLPGKDVDEDGKNNATSEEKPYTSPCTFLLSIVSAGAMSPGHTHLQWIFPPIIAQSAVSLYYCFFTIYFMPNGSFLTRTTDSYDFYPSLIGDSVFLRGFILTSIIL
jgi:hypothetical protein